VDGHIWFMLRKGGMDGRSADAVIPEGLKGGIRRYKFSAKDDTAVGVDRIQEQKDRFQGKASKKGPMQQFGFWW